jgi:NAD-dependent SIR2 family protein deacetylase
MDEDSLHRAAQAIREAQALLIGAGAGMGVDSDLPDFRGNQGFWNAYPPYQKLGLNFVDLANPRWFRKDPCLAWGFYGHRLNLYRHAQPHEGFHILRRWAERMKFGAFVFTSNVDGHFQRAGFSQTRVMEVHGAINFMQCFYQCRDVFPADGLTISIDETTMRALLPLPTCPRCRALARPNILMFNDWEWDDSRKAKQEGNMNSWLQAVSSSPMVVVECGAGTSIPTVRHFCEEIADHPSRKLIRINVREPEVPEGHISMATGALAGLQSIDEILTVGQGK